MDLTLRRITAIALALMVPVTLLLYLTMPGPPETIYEVNVFSHAGDESAIFIIEVPVAQEPSGGLPTFFSVAPEISGEVLQWNIVETAHGGALRLEGRGSAVLTWRSAEPIRGPWPLPGGVRFPGGNPDLSMWVANASGDEPGYIGLVDLHLERWDGAGAIGFYVGLGFFRGDCDGFTHRAGFPEATALGWARMPLESAGLRCA